ncbi:MAG: flagellar protein FlhE [Pseudomonadota bacterium]
MMRMKGYFLLAVLLASVNCFLASSAFCASGSWSTDAVGPDMSLAGRTYSVTFSPYGNIPAGATIVAISWRWSVGNYRSDLKVSIGSSNLGFTDISNLGSGITYAFVGGNPNQNIFLNFNVPGTGTINPPIIGQSCTVTVSWEDSTPPPTEISGPSAVECGQTIELDGTVQYATIYTWTTDGGCSLTGAADTPTVTIQGNQNGLCTVTRVACSNQGACTTDTHNITVSGQVLLLPMLQLLLLK